MSMQWLRVLAGVPWETILDRMTAKKGSANPGPPAAGNPVVREAPAPSVAGAVSNSETLDYQNDHLLDELNLIETHLSEGGRIAGKPCDCIAKAGRRIKAFAYETIPIAERQGRDSSLYVKLAEWGKKMQEIGTPEVIATGEHDLQAESGVASNLRKTLSRQVEAVSTETPPTPTELAQEVNAGRITRDEALNRLRH